jgi:hypothetical protein
MVETTDAIVLTSITSNPAKAAFLSAAVTAHNTPIFQVIGTTAWSSLISGSTAKPVSSHKFRSAVTARRADDASKHLDYEKIEADLALVITSALDSDFEDGVQSNFSKQLEAFIVQHGSRGINVLVQRITRHKIVESMAAEALRWFGAFQHPYTKDHRLWVLEKFLFSQSFVIRDAAVLGLANLNAAAAAPYLRKAAKIEKNASLREDMVALAEQIGD